MHSGVRSSNQALQPTRNPSLRYGSQSAELRRWASE